MTGNIRQEFNAKFRVDELAIHRTKHWTWSVRPVHSTLGAGVLSLNRPCEAMGDLSAEEAADLSDMCRTIENTLREFSSPSRMNYVMLMMVDPHLHFHVLPRYPEPQEFDGREWVDNGWPALPGLGDNADLATSAHLLSVRDALRGLIQA